MALHNPKEDKKREALREIKKMQASESSKSERTPQGKVSLIEKKKRLRTTIRQVSPEQKKHPALQAQSLSDFKRLLKEQPIQPPRRKPKAADISDEAKQRIINRAKKRR